MSDYELKVVRVRRNNHRDRERTLKKHARDGWELVETARGATLSSWDHVTLRRPASWKADRKAEKKAQQAEAVERFDAWRESRRAKSSAAPAASVSTNRCSQGDHVWTNRTSDDDRRNGVKFYACGLCGAGRTESV